MTLVRTLMTSIAISVLAGAHAAGAVDVAATGTVDGCEPRPVDAAYERAARSTVALQDSAGTSFGTGVIWDRLGRIVTNRHVAMAIGNGTAQYVDGHGTAVRVEHVFEGLDLAVLVPAVPSPKAQPVRRAARRASIGSRVMALGNPFGVGISLSVGIVSATDRTVNVGGGALLIGAVQTDAALNPGNSGGPLLDEGGCMIGMNTAIISGLPSASGVGFAIPVATIDHAMASLGTDAENAVAGLSDPGPELGVIAEDGRGMIHIVEVEPGSRADKAGIMRGDVILGVAGHEVRTVDHAIAVLSVSAGDIPLRIGRGTITRNLVVEGRRS